jgi:predicted HicB family RNase H-like nuclease
VTDITDDFHNAADEYLAFCAENGKQPEKPFMMTRVAKEKDLSFELKIPNALTAETLEKADRGEDLHEAKDAADLFRKLGL